MFHNSKISKIQIYGTGTIGQRGQIVVPAKARNELNINSGDEFIFFGHGSIIHIVKTHELDNILDSITRRFSAHIAKIREIKKRKS